MSNTNIIDSFRLNDRVALVTGASRGLGKAISQGLAEAGAAIIGVSTAKEKLLATQSLVEEKGRPFHAIGANLSDRAATDQMIEEALGIYARIDILINNAGIIRRSPASEFSDRDWDEVIETNLSSVFRICRAIGAAMLTRGYGRIINIASLLSFTGGITVPSYASSKAGIAVLTKSLANEWSNQGVTVNAIAPGYFATDNTAALRSNEERNRQILERIPSGRWGDPADLMGAAVFLASDAAQYVTGHTLAVDGGFLAR